MQVTELQNNQFKLEMNDEEKKHFQIIAVAANNMFITDVPTCLGYILTYVEQHWYEVLDDTNCSDLGFPGKESARGN